MYSNADTFVGSIDCVMCGAVINPVSQPSYVSEGAVRRPYRCRILLSTFGELESTYDFLFRTQIEEKRKRP